MGRDTAFGRRLAELRAERGLSLRQLGELVYYSRSHLHDLEHGVKQPTPATAQRLDDVLSASGQLAALADSERLTAPTERSWPLARTSWSRDDVEALAAGLLTEPPTPDSALRIAHEWLVAEPPQVYEMHAGRHIGADTVEQVEQRVHQLRLLDDHLGGADTYQLVTGELDATLTLLRGAAYTEDVGRRLLVAVGELCQVAGWVTYDAGRHQEAARLYLAGVRAAHAGGDVPGAANNLSCLAYQIANVGNPHEAALLARSALRGAERGASAGTRAVLLERVAWVNARVGEPAATGRALDRVEEVVHEPGPDRWVHQVPLLRWLIPPRCTRCGRRWPCRNAWLTA